MSSIVDVLWNRGNRSSSRFKTFPFLFRLFLTLKLIKVSPETYRKTWVVRRKQWTNWPITVEYSLYNWRIINCDWSICLLFTFYCLIFSVHSRSYTGLVDTQRCIFIYLKRAIVNLFRNSWRNPEIFIIRLSFPDVPWVSRRGHRLSLWILWNLSFLSLFANIDIFYIYECVCASLSTYFSLSHTHTQILSRVIARLRPYSPLLLHQSVIDILAMLVRTKTLKRLTLFSTHIRSVVPYFAARRHLATGWFLRSGVEARHEQAKRIAAAGSSFFPLVRQAD